MLIELIGCLEIQKTAVNQVAKLKARGLTFGNEAEAELCLSNISYYRLKAYTMNWKSVRQQNLQVTIKYPELVAEMFPHFEGHEIPPFGKDNLWFL